MFWIKRNRIHLGCFDPKPNPCQASLRDGNSKYHESDGKHLQSILFPPSRRTEVYPGNVIDDELFSFEYLYLYGYEDSTEEGEQGVIE